jgi:hypothetical protein
MSLPDDSFIFVSYSSKDSDFVLSEIKRLELQGYAVWYDKGRLQPSQVWADDISQAIKECACFIVFITEYAVKSKHVGVEIAQALQVKKPIICIYWEKVELPPEFREPIQRIQALERYSISSRERQYEEPLDRALSKYVKRTRVPRKESGVSVKAPDPPPPATQSVLLSKIVFFSLLLLVVIFVFLAAAAFISPHLATYPGDPLGNRLSGFLAGSTFIVIAFGLSVAALAVYHIYVRRKK